ncbi:MAG: hypothetical protein V7784_01295 [Oceanospirillaceae bacterium]
MESRRGLFLDVDIGTQLFTALLLYDDKAEGLVLNVLKPLI